VQSLGLDAYFAFPRISWQPKSQSVLEIVEAFNVGADTVAVIDDSPFERAEIAERCPGVRVYADEQALELPDLPEFRPAISEESARRRLSYKTEEAREITRASFADDYESFLRSCAIVAEVARPAEDNLARVHELVQRTNQLNFSGRRYTIDELRGLLAREDVLPLAVKCRDRFGDYGLVGFILVDLDRSCITDLAFSCRVQAKGVERAVLSHLMARLSKNGAQQLNALFKPSAKNGPARAILGDVGFQLDATDAATGVEQYSYPFARGLPDAGPVTIDWEQGT
jgi:FkbH-like protein